LLGENPDLAFITDELCEHCYPDAEAIGRKHRVAVLRAARNVVTADPDWTAWRIDGMGRGYVFLNRANLQSYTLGRMIAKGMVDRSEGRARRRPWRVDCVSDRRELLAIYAAGGNNWFTQERVKEGDFADDVTEHIALRDGDTATAEAFRAKRQAAVERWIALGRKCFPAAVGDGLATLTRVVPAELP
jgi:hypothetical protein